MMKAVGVYQSLPVEDPACLVDLEVERPSVSGRDILVRVEAVSVNPVDAMMRSSEDGAGTTPRILGWDVAGVVEEVGPDCTLFAPLDEVYYAGSLVRQGGNAEYHTVDERIVGRKPRTLDFAEAAALPLTSLTAWEALYERLGVSKERDENVEKTILIIGAAGGVGSIATELAKFSGLTVIGTASRPESVNWVRSMGADYVVNHHEDLLVQLKAVGFEAIDYIFCLSSIQDYWTQLAEIVAPQGAICAIAGNGEPVALDLLFYKSAKFVWELMFTRSMYQTPDMVQQHAALDEVADLIDAGMLKTTLHTTYSPINAENVRRAHALLESKSSIGKIVVKGF